MLQQTCKKKNKKLLGQPSIFDMFFIFGSKGSFYVTRGTAADPQTGCGWFVITGDGSRFQPQGPAI